jgi:hypothetical protein
MLYPLPVYVCTRSYSVTTDRSGSTTGVVATMLYSAACGAGARPTSWYQRCCCLTHVALEYPGGWFGGVQTPPPPRNSEVLKKLAQIPSSVEYTSVTN